VVSHAATRIILGRILGRNPTALSFQSRCGHCGQVGHGKPYLSSGHSGIEFNIAHSGELALVAVAHGRPVGVDVERVRDRTDVLGVARSALSAAEHAAIESIAVRDRRSAFFTCWTRKEAYLKARAVGIAGGLSDFTVSPVDAGRVSPQVPDDPTEAERWSISSLYPGPGYAAAVASEGRFEVTCWEPELG
jgi:4'-phosphopantetheinyl transferase